MDMSFSEQLRIMLKRKGITIATLAAMTNQSTANLSAKMQRDNFDERQMHQLAEAIGCSFKVTLAEKE